MMMYSLLAVGGMLLGQDSGQTELTIYNGGFALVKEQRVFDLKTGTQMVAVEDVAQMIEANSVGIRSLSTPGSFVVLEQNYRYDLVSPQAILAKAVGQKITFNRVLPDGRKERLQGTLMSAPTAMVSNGNGRVSGTWNGMVIQTDDGRVILNPHGEIEVSSIPDGLISKPTLVWMLNSAKAGRNNVELSYLTQGMSWKSDYVLSLDGEGKIGDLKGWVTLTNNSGTSFEGAKLKLLAGDVARQRQPMQRGGFGGGGMVEKTMDAGFSEEQFGDYHLYVLPRPASVLNREIKQVSLLEASGVKVGKRLVFDFAGAFGPVRPNPGRMLVRNQKPSIYIDLKNTEENQLGMPLPMGTVKVFQRDSGGSLQMLGEDSIQHTPKKETLELRVGKAFDVVGDRTRTGFEWLGSSSTPTGSRETYEIEIRNRKDEDEVVYVTHAAYVSNKMIETNFEAEKVSNEIYKWKINMKADSTVMLKFVIESYWRR